MPGEGRLVNNEDAASINLALNYYFCHVTGTDLDGGGVLLLLLSRGWGNHVTMSLMSSYSPEMKKESLKFWVP